MLTDLLMEKYKKAYKPMMGCYVLPYYEEKFNAYFSEEKARQIAMASEMVVDEILDMTDEETLTSEILEEFEAEVHERHKDSEVHENETLSSNETNILFVITDAFYNGGPFRRPAFEEATRMVGRANGDDVNSVDWQINLQTLFYATIYTVMEQALTLSREEIPEQCGWLFFCNCIHHMSGASGGQRYHIKISEEKSIENVDEFRDELREYLLEDRDWQFEEERIRIDDNDRLVISVPQGANTFDLKFSVQTLFEQYRSGGWNTVHKEISYARDAVYSVDPSQVGELLSSYETALPHLMLRPLNYVDHRSDLVKHVYVTVGDIALVLYFVVSDHDGQLNTTKVPADRFRDWGTDKETVIRNALLNNVLQAQPRLYTDVKDMEHPPLSKGAFMAIDAPVESLPRRGAVVTTTRKINGAMALFYPGAQERIAALCQDDYYVVFTSTSEAWVHPKSASSPKSLLLRLKENNKAFPGTLLSRKIFLYERSEKLLKALEL